VIEANAIIAEYAMPGSPISEARAAARAGRFRRANQQDVSKHGSMGKRSNFERREADFYETPRAAVLPLIPFLRGIKAFAEPCADEGALVRHLESFGLRCVYQGDIRTGRDDQQRFQSGSLCRPQDQTGTPVGRPSQAARSA
jgi:hypothetical protein